MTLEKYKKPLIIATAVVVVYALLGFFLAPWLVERTATNAVRDNLGVGHDIAESLSQSVRAEPADRRPGTG